MKESLWVLIVWASSGVSTQYLTLTARRCGDATQGDPAKKDGGIGGGEDPLHIGPRADAYQ